MTSEKLQVRYTGTAAENYDAGRQTSKRFRREEAVFANYFAKIGARSVIDCPYGTGRWLDYYRPLAGPVVAVDLSSDMLKAAEAKAGSQPPADIRYVTASVFDLDFKQFQPLKIDLLVCTRFVNWVPAEMASQAVFNLSQSGTRWAIIGASVRPAGLKRTHKVLMRLRLFRDNLLRRASRDRQKVVQHVHSESLMLKAFRDNGWKVVQRQRIFGNPTRENFFWLLKRA